MDEIAFHRAMHRPGTLVDVGAHDGMLTLPFARLPDSRVLAFEPLPPAFAPPAARPKRTQITSRGRRSSARGRDKGFTFVATVRQTVLAEGRMASWRAPSHRA